MKNIRIQIKLQLGKSKKKIMSTDFDKNLGICSTITMQAKYKKLEKSMQEIFVRRGGNGLNFAFILIKEIFFVI